MRYRIILALVLVLTVGCSTIHPAKIIDGAALSRAGRAYVVKHENSTAGIDLAIQAALAQHGLAVRTGSMLNKPNGTDVYVTYVDRWTWDIAMYLKSLTISIFDNRTDKLIASGSFKNSVFFHSFPDVDSKTAEVVDSIFQKTEPAP